MTDTGIATLLRQLDLSGAILLGHSLGCRVVLEAARLDPERVGGLVLMDGSRQAMGAADAARRSESGPGEPSARA